MKHQIRIRENRIEKLTAKYDIILKSLGGRLEVRSLTKKVGNIILNFSEIQKYSNNILKFFVLLT